MIVLERGEAQIELAGHVYTLKIGHGVFRVLETMFRGLTVQQVLALANAGSYTHSAGILQALLKKHHPDLTTDQIDDLVDAAGGMEKVDEVVAPLITQMLPATRDLQKLGIDKKPPNPRKARAPRAAVSGTGTASSVKPAALA